MTYYYKIGKNSDKETTFALALLPYLGTSKHSLAEINQEFYRIACDMDVVEKDEDCTITLSGLGSNFEQALSLMEEVLNDCQPDQEALDNLVNNVLKRRKDQKSNQQEIFNALISYSVYGKNSPYNNILSEDSLKGLTAEELVSKIRSLGDIEHQVIYYGPMKADELCQSLESTMRQMNTLNLPRN